MPALKNEPSGTVETLGEFLALSHAMEGEAARNYAKFAELMRQQSRCDLAESFDRIAGEERGHAANVERWSQGVQGRQPESQPLRWLPPPTFEPEEAAEITGSQLLTPYRVLSIAVRNEERAFAFWAYVAAQTRNDEVRQAAEAMAREELEHVTTFRRERRKAFHALRQAAGGPAATVSAADLEAALAAQLRRDTSAMLPQLRAELIRETDAIGAEAEPLQVKVISAGGDSAEALAEALVEAYLQAAEASRDDENLRRLQELGQRAVLRLATLRDATRQLA